MEQENNLVQKMSYNFSIKCILLYKKVTENKKEYVLSKQFLRSATSIGANIEEWIGWQSRKDFIAKISIAQKEAKETHYWLRLLHDTDYITHDDFELIESDNIALIKILSKILITSKSSSEEKIKL